VQIEVKIAAAALNFCGLKVKNLLLILNADNISHNHANTSHNHDNTSHNHATIFFSYCRLLIFMLFELQVSTINNAKVVLDVEVLELRHHIRTTRKM